MEDNLNPCFLIGMMFGIAIGSLLVGAILKLAVHTFNLDGRRAGFTVRSACSLLFGHGSDWVGHCGDVLGVSGRDAFCFSWRRSGWNSGPTARNELDSPADSFVLFSREFHNFYFAG